MQRLSIDSSASKLHSYGGRKDDIHDHDDLKHKESLSSPPLSSSSSTANYDDDELKDFKPRRLSLQSPTHQNGEKLVHFIPVLTLICFIILYLSSHAPSQSDLAQFNGFMRRSKHLDSDEDGEISKLMISSDALAIRSSIRNLKETESSASESLPRRRTSHRKIADF
ncbi:hypothetical protein HID58_059032 [Brassica napus]|uniref:Uncharacterized protein n=2 Tax=Brassica TaxID=3705 RepID=A0ABQ7ZSG7_BRANA|nr:uncharacterized protein LOC125585464 [Brassica napus]KAF3552822.1 hypothetical protein F2Q69_00011215 [Brassica cretica]KAH0882936.1 hypothetical protein HID58_059032 [Brassica napus]